MKKTFLIYLLSVYLVPPGSLLAQKIAAGGRHSLAICSDSTVRSWGYNGYGQLGNGTLAEQHTGVQVSGLTGITQVAGGLFHSLFVQSNGTAWACGRNSLGPLGDGTSINKTTPVQVNGLNGIIQAAGGGEHSLFLKNDGTVWACGANSSGQLGDGTNTSKTTAVQVLGLTGIVQVAGGAEYSLFLRNDSTVWACGHNGYGQFGNATNTSSNIPVHISGLSAIVQITAGEWHSIFIKNDGTVYSCGRNQYGQLGDGTTTDKNTVSQISALSGIVQAEAGGLHSVFVKNDGTVFSCGLNSGGNNNGQLGDGTIADRYIPVQVIPSWGTGRIIHAEATREHSLYLKDNGQLWGSGRNNYGQLGYGAFTISNSSTSVQASTVCPILTVQMNDTKSSTLEISIHPNPFSTQTILRTDHFFNDATLTICNSIGQIIKQLYPINGNTITLHRDNLPEGLYFTRLTQGNVIIATYKLLITD